MKNFNILFLSIDGLFSVLGGSIFVLFCFVFFLFVCLFFLISVTLSPSVFALYSIFKTIYYRSFETATMNKFKSVPYLNSSISHISFEPRSQTTV